jgi:starch phosphorylase
VYDHDYYLVSQLCKVKASFADNQVSNDFGSYLEATKLVDELWGGDPEEWTKKSILTSFAMGEFSSDRSVQDYADGIWSSELPLGLRKHEC